ncbi:MAG: DUF3137 domain-containing protein [Bacteroidia bacterium]
MNTEISFRQFYDTHLREKAIAFNGKKLGAIIAGFFCRIFIVIFFIAIISLILGFLNMFPFDEFGTPAIEYFFKGFFLLVLSIIIIAHARTRIKEDLVPKYPGFFKIEQSITIVALVFWAIVLVSGWFIGTNFLGKEFGLTFFAKWGGTILTMAFLMLPFKLLERVENNFYSKYKSELLPEIVKYANTSANYIPDKFIEQGIFEESKLFPAQTIWDYKGSDFFKGQNDKTTFEFSQLHVIQKEVKRSNGKTETSFTDLFRGIFYKADFNKNFSGETFVVPDISREFFGSYLGEMLNKKAEGLVRQETKLVYMEDVEFEKLFAVFSSDQQEARYILSPSLMQKITALKNKFSNDMYLAFRNGSLYIGVAATKDFFAPNLFGNIDDYETIEKHYLLIKNLFDIAEELGLNTRIWTKQ